MQAKEQVTVTYSRKHVLCLGGGMSAFCAENPSPNSLINDSISPALLISAEQPLFEQERVHLLDCMPPGLIIRIEHFGSTAIVGLAAKPIVDMVIEVNDVARARTIVPRILEPQGYDSFWRPTLGDDTPPWYTWCIKRNATGQRTHHLHFGEISFKTDELRFRDILREQSVVAAAYAELKLRLANEHNADRIAYTKAKGDFIQNILRQARGNARYDWQSV